MFFIFLPSTIGIKTELIAMPIIENVRINDFPIAIDEVIDLGVTNWTTGHIYGYFWRSGSNNTVSYNAIPVDFRRDKIATTINNRVIKNLCLKGWRLAIVGYQKFIGVIKFIHNKIRSVANSHGFFRNIILLATDPYGEIGKNNQSYILYKCKIYALAMLSFISFGLSIVSFSLIFQPSIRAFFGFGFSTFVFAMICHVSMEKEMYLRVFAKPDSAHQTNETTFAFNMLMVLIGLVTGMIVMYFVKYNITAQRCGCGPLNRESQLKSSTKIRSQKLALVVASAAADRYTPSAYFTSGSKFSIIQISDCVLVTAHTMCLPSGVIAIPVYAFSSLSNGTVRSGFASPDFE